MPTVVESEQLEVATIMRLKSDLEGIKADLSTIYNEYERLNVSLKPLKRGYLTQEMVSAPYQIFRHMLPALEQARGLFSKVIKESDSVMSLARKIISLSLSNGSLQPEKKATVVQEKSMIHDAHKITSLIKSAKRMLGKARSSFNTCLSELSKSMRRYSEDISMENRARMKSIENINQELAEAEEPLRFAIAQLGRIIRICEHLHALGLALSNTPANV